MGYDLAERLDVRAPEFVSGEVEVFEPRRSTLSALVGERGLQIVIWGDLEAMERTDS